MIDLSKGPYDTRFNEEREKWQVFGPGYQKNCRSENRALMIASYMNIAFAVASRSCKEITRIHYCYDEASELHMVTMRMLDVNLKFHLDQKLYEFWKHKSANNKIEVEPASEQDILLAESLRPKGTGTTKDAKRT